MHKPINFEIINDHNLPLCFVGRGSLNTNLFNVVKHYRESIIVDIESLDSKLPEWVDNYQFGSFVSDIILKEKIVSKLNDNQAKFFSIIGPNNVVHPSVTIGHNTFINNYNDFVTGDLIIGNHCIVTAFIQAGHGTIINDFCHVSAYSYLHRCNLGTGTVVGIRSSIIGGTAINDVINIAPYCNFITESTVTKSVEVTGTYYGNRRISQLSSKEHRIL